MYQLFEKKNKMLGQYGGILALPLLLNLLCLWYSIILVFQYYGTFSFFLKKQLLLPTALEITFLMK